MSNTDNKYLEGAVFSNISVIPNADLTEDGSIEAAGTLFVNTIREYDISSIGVTLEGSIFAAGKAIITSTEPSQNASTSSLIVYGGISAYKDSLLLGSLLIDNTSDSVNLSTGSLILASGGASINGNVNIGGVITLWDEQPSTDASYGSLISLGGIGIRHTTDAISYTSGGALTIAGGASVEKTLYAKRLFSNWSTLGDLFAANVTATNLLSTNANLILLTSGSIVADNISTSSLSSTDFNGINATVSNLISTYNSFSNALITNGTVTNLYSSNIQSVSINSSIGNIESLTVGNLFVINNIEHNDIVTNISSSNIICDYSTIGNLDLNQGTFSYLYGIDLWLSNLTVSNILNNQITTTYLNSTNARILKETVGNSLITNASISNAVITNVSANNISNLYTTSESLLLTGTIPSYNSTTGTLISYGGISINCTEDVTSLSSGGGLTDAGGATIAKSLLVGGTVSATSITAGGIYGADALFINIYGENITISNVLYNNATINNLVVTNLDAINSSVTNLIGNNGILSNGTINNLVSTSIDTIYSTIDNLLVTSITTTNVIGTSGSFDYLSTNNLLSSNITSTNAVITNLQAGDINFTGTLYKNGEPFIPNQYWTAVSNGNIVYNTTAGNGYVGINTTNPLYTLDVGGDVHVNNTILIDGTVPSYNSTTGSIITNGGVSVNCTVNALSSTNGGGVTIVGGLGVGKDVYVGGDLWVSGKIDVNSHLITNVTAPSVDLDVANKWYVDNRLSQFTGGGNISGNFTQGQVIVATTAGNIAGYDSFIYDVNSSLLELYGTTDATSLSQGGTFKVYGGASIDKNLYVGGNAHILGYLDMNNQKITSVAIPTTYYDAANKYYVDNLISELTVGNVNGNFTQGQVIVASTEGNITSFASFTFLNNVLSINSTEDAINLTSGGVLDISGGARIQKSLFIGGPALQIPVGNNLARPIVPNNGYIRYNTELEQFEGFGAGNSWGTLGGVIDIAKTTKVLASASPGITDGNLYFYTVGGERMRINSAGNVGIGTTSPTATLDVNGDLFVSSGINANNQIITNVTAPSVDLDVANKWYVDTRLSQFTGGNIISGGSISGNFTQGQVIVASSSGQVIGFNNFTFDGNTLSIQSTKNASSTSGGVVSVSGGAKIAKDVYIGGKLDVNNNKITNVSVPVNPLDAVNKEYVDFFLGLNNGDIKETTFILNNNVVVPTDITSFLFQNTDVSSFQAMAYLEIPELNIYDQWILNGILKGSEWVMNEKFIGDYPSNVQLSIINTGTAGQIQYTNSNVSGTAKLRFRATTTSQGIYTNITIASAIYDVNIGGTGQTFFTEGSILVGNGTDPIQTYADLKFVNDTLVLGNTTNAINLSTGAMVISGGIAVAKDVQVGEDLDVKGDTTLENDVSIGGVLDMNNNKIISVPIPVNPLDAVNKEYVDFYLGLNNGDLKDTTFVLDNNVLVPTNVDAFLFQNADVSSFQAIAYLEIPELNIYDQWILNGVLKGEEWVMNEKFIGDYPSNVKFSIINDGTAGQIQYTNSNVTGTATLRFRATTTSQGVYTNITIGNIIRDVSLGGTGQTFFTVGSILVGDGINPIQTYADLKFVNDSLILSSTTNATNLSNGSLLVSGGVAIGKNVQVGQDLNVRGDSTLDNNVSIGGVLDMSNNKITSVSLPVNSLDAVNKEYVDFYLGINNGDIKDTTFILNNNVLIPTNVTTFLFENTDVSSFQAMVYLEIPELNIYDQWILNGVLKGSVWIMNEKFIGDYPSNVHFSIINTGTAGQIQYINLNSTGTARLRFRATTTSQGVYTNITIGNVVRQVNVGGTGQTFFTAGSILVGNGEDPIQTYADLNFVNDTLVLGSTTNSTNLSSGAMIVSGGIAVKKNMQVGEELYVNNIKFTPSPGDIFSEVSFSANNNQINAADVTGFKFDNNIVRYFHAFVSVHIETSSGTIDAGYELKGLQTNNSNWLINSTFMGEQSNIIFSITNSGQIQYTSSNIINWVSTTMKFRALSTSI